MFISCFTIEIQIRYGGSSSAINKMLMKAKQAEKLEEGLIKFIKILFTIYIYSHKHEIFIQISKFSCVH